ncbi:uncharacterized protein LOC129592160 [Paramacrobiotus metropolitanus]|uniref:uncharacterized protein LOC129592160 n=1 Tax=Paramacrobiotus metropolitanus TaxID=2943436 RepID=UPI00244599CB|nr:uncharacterized protein LOC129592160 [Paramacrobiotus metropolitanus]
MSNATAQSQALNTNGQNISSSSQFHPRNWSILQAFCGVSGTLLVILAALSILTILTMLHRRSTLSGSRILLFHQITIETQMTLFYWPVNSLVLQFIYTKYSATANRFCQHFTYGFMITLTAIWWGLFFIALNRFIAVARPHSYARWITRPALAVQILVPWIIGIACMMYHYVGGDGGFLFVESTRACHVPQGTGLNVASIFYSYLPLVLIWLLYITTFLVVWRNNRQRKAQVTAHGEAVRSAPVARRVTLAKMLFAVSVVHTVCFITIPILYSIMPDVPRRYPIVRQWTNLVTYIGYLSTPISVFIMNKDYQDSAKELLSGKWRTTIAVASERHGLEISYNKSMPASTHPISLPVRSQN